VLALALLAWPVTAAAQTVSPTTPVHPSMPWSGITTPQGQLLRYIYVPPQSVTLEYVMPAPAEIPSPAAEPSPPSVEGDTKTAEKPPEPVPPSEGAPPGPQIVRQQVTVPGYYVRETTVGFLYPDRWAIEQAAPNVYRWRQIPAQFVPK
jgi:hypothetical protein